MVKGKDINYKGINTLMQTANANWSNRIFTLVVMLLLLGSAFFGTFMYIKYKQKPAVAKNDSECEFVKEQYRQAMNFIIEIRKTESSSLPTSYIEAAENDYYMFASMVDTVPKKKNIIISKIDSFINKQKIDSARRADSLKKRKL